MHGERVAFGTVHTAWIVDARDPARPVREFEVPISFTGSSLRFVAPELLHVGRSSIGAELVDLTDPDALVRARMPRGGPLSPARPEGYYTLDDGPENRLSLLRIEGVADVEVVQDWPYEGYVVDFAVFDGPPTRVALSRVGRFEVYDLAPGPLDDPVAAFSDRGRVEDLSSAGDRVYVADGAGGLRVIDIADPERPRLVDIELPEPPDDDVTRLAFEGGRLVLFERNMGLLVYDVDGWRLLDRMPVEGPLTGVALAFADGRVWLADYGDIRAFSLSADGLRLEAELPFERSVRGIAPLDAAGWLAVGTPDALLTVRLDDAGFEIVGEVPWRTWAHDLSRAGDRLYVAGGFGGVLSVDVSDPAAPVVLDRALVDVEIVDVAAHAERVVALTADEQVWVVEIEGGRFGAVYALETREAPERIALGPDGRTLFMGGWDAVLDIARLGCR